MPKLIDFRSRFLPFFPNQRFRKCGGKYSPDRNALFIRQLHFLPLRWLAQKESYILGFPFNFHLLASRLWGRECQRLQYRSLALWQHKAMCTLTPHDQSAEPPRVQLGKGGRDWGPGAYNHSHQTRRHIDSS